MSRFESVPCESGPDVNTDTHQLAVAAETHEASVLAACFDAAAAEPGNPLGAIVDRSFMPPLALAQAIDSDEINRVVGLGVASTAERDAVAAVVAFFESHGQPRFRIDLSPVARPPQLREDLESLGLRPLDHTITKKVRSTGDALSPPIDVEVRLLGRGDRDAVAELNLMAWGAWEVSDPLRTWFGSIVGTRSFRHFGAFDGDRLVSVQALSIRDVLGWTGFAATHPRYRGHRLNRSISQVSHAHARDRGCRIVHTEMDTRFEPSSEEFWETLYERTLYSPVGRWPR